MHPGCSRRSGDTWRARFTFADLIAAVRVPDLGFAFLEPDGSTEPGVIEFGSDETRFKRKRKLLRVPESVLVRVHQQQRVN